MDSYGKLGSLKNVMTQTFSAALACLSPLADKAVALRLKPFEADVPSFLLGYCCFRIRPCTSTNGRPNCASLSSSKWGVSGEYLNSMKDIQKAGKNANGKNH